MGGRKKLPIGIFTLILFIALSVSIALSQQSSEKARQILERTFQKYSDLFNENAKRPKSIASRVSIRGRGKIEMNKSKKAMPMDLDAMVEMYVEKPHRLYLSISGSMGSAQVVVPGGKPLIATVILPITKQFATVKIPESTFRNFRTGNGRDFWKKTILAYGGTQSTKAGRAHKINIRSKDPSKKESLTVYILDNKWDPTMLEINDPKNGNVVMEVQRLELDANVPKGKFSADTRGYTQISGQQLASVIMMQIMASAMQKSRIK